MRPLNPLAFLCAFATAALAAEKPPLYPIKVHGKWGYMNRQGKVVVEPRFDHADDFYDGMGRIVVGRKKVFIDKAGKVVIRPPSNQVWDFSDDLARIRVDGKYGYIDKTGKMVIKPQFEDAHCFHEGLAAVSVDGKRFGCIDKMGKLVIPHEFTWIDFFSEGLSWARRDEKYVCIDKTGKKVFDGEKRIERVFAFKCGRAPVQINGKWGYVDRRGRLVIPAKYDYVRWFSEDLGAARLGRKWGYVDKAGRHVIEFTYDWAFPFSEGLGRVCLRGKEGFFDGKEGFIDRKGKVVITPRFGAGWHRRGFCGGLAPVRIEGEHVYINKAGEIAIKGEFTGAQPFSEGRAAVWVFTRGDLKWGYVDNHGHVVVAPRFQSAGQFCCGLALVELQGRHGFVDDKGQVAVPPKYVDALRFAQGLAPVEVPSNGWTLWGYVNKNGETAIPPRFLAAESFSEGLAFVLTKKGDTGYIDRTGKLAFTVQDCISARSFQEGLAAVLIGEDDEPKWGFVDKLGVLAIRPQFKYAHWFSEGLAAVAPADKKWGYIDKQGKYQIKPRFEQATTFDGGLAPVSVAGKWGYIDKTGKIVIEPKYKWADPFSEGLADVEVSEFYHRGFIDQKGHTIIPPRKNIIALDFRGGLARIKIRGPERKFGYIDRTGKWVWEPTW